MAPLLRMKSTYLTGFLEPSEVSVGDCVVIHYPLPKENGQFYSPVFSVQKIKDIYVVTVEATWKSGERLVLKYAPGDLCEIVIKGKA